MLEASPADWPRLAGYEAEGAEVIDADVSTFSGASDKVLRVRGRPDWLLDVGFQAGPDATVPARSHVYNVLLGHRHGLPVRSVVLLLRPQANLASINGVHTRQFPGEEPYEVFRYRVLRLWEMPVERFLSGGPGVVPLAPLAAVTPGQLPDVLDRLKARLNTPRVRPHQKDL